jgi:hypothetical protein
MIRYGSVLSDEGAAYKKECISKRALTILHVTIYYPILFRPHTTKTARSKEGNALSRDRLSRPGRLFRPVLLSSLQLSLSINPHQPTYPLLTPACPPPSCKVSKTPSPLPTRTGPLRICSTTLPSFSLVYVSVFFFSFPLRDYVRCSQLISPLGRCAACHPPLPSPLSSVRSCSRRSPSYPIPFCHLRVYFHRSTRLTSRTDLFPCSVPRMS